MTTTDDTALTERIARALRRHDAETHGWSGQMMLTVEVRDYLPAAAAVLPIIRAEVAKARSETRRDSSWTERGPMDSSPASPERHVS